MLKQKMPSLMYGTAWKEERTEDLVFQALKLGFRGIDTACQPKHYNEAGVGNALLKLNELGLSRDEIFLQTKFTPLGGHDPMRIPYDPSAPLEEQVRQSFSRSLTNLHTSYLDSLVLHSPVYPYENLKRVWSTMEELVLNGMVGQIGISNCYELELLQNLYQDTGVKPSIVQNRFYLQSGYDIELRKWCSAHGIVYQSFWSLTANPHLLGSFEMSRLAEKYDKTPAQVLYRYLSHRSIVPLIGSTSAEHLKQDLDIFSFELANDEVSSIDSLLERIVQSAQ